MFTGLVEDVGEVDRLEASNDSIALTVETNLPLKTVGLGASVAINGACLTVVSKGRKTLRFDVSPETLKRTSLETLRPGSLVNIERAMRLSDRLGGHLVTGHVDGTAAVQSIKPKGEYTFWTFSLPAPLGSLLVTKGSVVVDGISLTVNECAPKRFSVAIVPFTLRHTNLRARRVGDKVNIETDLIGKYVYKFMSLRRFDPRALRL
jgi:riboflavin synthase